MIERKELLCTGSVEFPTVFSRLSTKPHQYLFMASGHDVKATTFGFPGGFCKLDAQTGDVLATFVAESFETVGEPCYVPKVGGVKEDDAYLLGYIVNGKDITTDVVVLDAKDLRVVSRERLPTFLSTGLHGRFVEDATYTF